VGLIRNLHELERRNRLLPAVFKHLEVALVEVDNGITVVIDDADVGTHVVHAGPERRRRRRLRLRRENNRGERRGEEPAEHLPQQPRDYCLGHFQHLVDPFGLLAARLGKVGPASAGAADDGRELLDDLARLHT
jgi:hypothetical protein